MSKKITYADRDLFRKVFFHNCHSKYRKISLGKAFCERFGIENKEISSAIGFAKTWELIDNYIANQ